MWPVATVQQIWNWKSMLAIKYKWMLYIWSSLPFSIFLCARGMLEWRKEAQPCKGLPVLLPVLSVHSWGTSHPLWNGSIANAPNCPHARRGGSTGSKPQSLCLGAAGLHLNRSSSISPDLIVRRKICEGRWVHYGCNDASAHWCLKTSPRQITVQTLKAKALLLEGVAGGVWHLRPPHPGPRQCCWMPSWRQKWVVDKSLPSREGNSPVSAALWSNGDIPCPWGSRGSLRKPCAVSCLGHQFAII